MSGHPGTRQTGSEVARRRWPWWLTAPALGAVLLYLVAAAIQVVRGGTLHTLVWPPYVLFISLLGGTIALGAEGIARLAGSRAWGIGVSCVLVPLLLLVLSLIQSERTPGVTFAWHSFLPFAGGVELYLIGYWAARTRVRF